MPQMTEKEKAQRERIKRIEASTAGDERHSEITTLSALKEKYSGDMYFIESKKHRECYLHPRPKLKTYQLEKGRVGAAIFKLADAQELISVTHMEDELEPVLVTIPSETN
jgi:hypothetical protein